MAGEITGVEVTPIIGQILITMFYVTNPTDCNKAWLAAQLQVTVNRVHHPVDRLDDAGVLAKHLLPRPARRLTGGAPQQYYYTYTPNGRVWAVAALGELREFYINQLVMIDRILGVS